MKKILVIVDPQYDFLDPRGSLYVKNDNLTQAINKYVFENDFDEVIITLDSHPANHCSFSTQGGQFPVHCVMGSLGASYDDFIKEIVLKKSAQIVEKGQFVDTEEFGAFGDGDDFDDYTPVDTSWRDVKVYVCGVAGDYCVKETIRNILDTSYLVDPDYVVVLKDLIVSIDDGSTLNKFIEEEGLQVE